MVKLLVAVSLAWPLVMGAAVLARYDERTAAWPVVVDVAGSRICHRIPERSFHSGGVQWPVCARCLGLYLAAPVGAIAAAALVRRRFDRALVLLAIAAAPTAVTLAAEWAGAAWPSNAWRFATALPLGAAVAWVIVATARRV